MVDEAPVNRATSFGARAEEYERVRPEYSSQALDLVVSRLGLAPTQTCSTSVPAPAS